MPSYNVVIDQSGRERTLVTKVRTVGELRRALHDMGFSDEAKLVLSVYGHTHPAFGFDSPLQVSDPSLQLDGAVCKISA